MEYSKIRFHDKPTIKKTDSKEYHIRKAQDDSIYQVITHRYDIFNTQKTLASIEYLSEEKYQELFPSDNIVKINYKDEYQKLKVVLDKYDIVQCNGCKEYSRDCDRCDLCDIWSCGCILIYHTKTWNLSGTYMCENCVLTHCYFCSEPKEITEPKDKNLCQKCESRFKK